MSQESVEHFLGRMLTDEGLRRMATGSMQLAMASNNFTFTKEESEALNSIDWDLFDLVACEIDKSIRRSASFPARRNLDERLEATAVMAKAG